MNIKLVPLNDTADVGFQYSPLFTFVGQDHRLRTIVAVLKAEDYNVLQKTILKRPL